MRIAVWFAIFLIVVAVAYLHLIGLPEFLKSRLLARLEAAGFEAQFSSVRLGWGPDLAIENAFFRRAGQPLAPQVSASSARLNFDLEALRKRRLQVSSFMIEGGKMAFPLSATNDEALSLSNVVLGASFPETNVMQITEASGEFHGLRIALNGTVTNYSVVHVWKPFHVRQQATESFQEQLGKFAQVVQQIHFGTPPQLHIHATADGSDPNSLRAELALGAGNTETPWGKAKTLQLSAAVAHLTNSADQPFVRVRLYGTEITTAQGRAAKLDLLAGLTRNAESNFNAAVDLSGTRLHGEAPVAATNIWFDAERLSINGKATLAGTNFLPLTFDGAVRGRQLASQPGSARDVKLDLRAFWSPPSSPPKAEWGPWAKLAPFTADWNAQFSKVDSPKLQLEEFDCTGGWRCPLLTLDRVQARAYGGGLAAAASLDIDTREIRVHSRSDIDPSHVIQLMPAPAQKFIADYKFEKAPQIEADSRLVLPEWVDRPADWRKQLLPSLQFSGQFTTGPSFYRSVPVASATSHFTYTNRVWDLPRIHVEVPGGEADVGYTADEVSHEYHFAVDSRVPPEAVATVIPPAAKEWLDQIRLSGPPEIHGELWGAWRARERTGVMGRVSLTNFYFRDLKVDSAEAALDFTNRLVRVTGIKVTQAGRQLTAGEVDADLDTQKIVLTNVISGLGPGALKGVLGARTPKFLETISFDTPPAIQLNGSFALRDPLATDLNFVVKGEHFHWTNFLVDRISLSAHWVGREIAITNLQSELYNTGALAGWGVFDYQPRLDTDFRGSFAAKDIDLRPLIKGFSAKRSKVEGMLDADLTITAGSFSTNTSWQGYGDVHVHDAMIWEIPVFGIFSPMLNAMSQGMGESRARDASATFRITNGVVGTDNLEIRATGITLHYSGTLGPNKQLNARMEAEVLRKIPGVSLMLGVILTPLSKLFEYKITGTISDPVAQPLYVPKFLMMMLRPFHTVKTLMPTGPAESTPLTAPKSVPPK